MTPAAGREFWRAGWFWAVLALVAALPFVVAPLPMMPDLFSHIGRYHVMNHGAESPFLPRYFAFHWVLIGNLGVDLLMVPLGQLLPTELAARIAVGLIPPLTIAGIYAVGTAAWGRIEAPALLALPLVYSFSLLFGFVNYHLALALALLVLALWLRCGSLALPLRWAVFAPLGLLVWIAHLSGWAVLLVAVAACELARGQGVASATRRSLPLLLPALLIAWQSRGGVVPQLYLWQHKLDWLLILLHAEWPVADGIGLALLLVAGYALLRGPGIRRHTGLLLAAGLLALCFVIVPNALMGSYFADQRLLAPLLMLGFLAFAMPPGRRETAVAVIGIILFGARITEISTGWRQRGAAAVADLAALDSVPRGARIALVIGPDACEDFALHSLAHLPSLAIVRREAFVNTQWDLPGPQLLRPLWSPTEAQCSTDRPLVARLAAVPRQRFDYVWVLGAAAAPQPWLSRVHAGPRMQLYRVITARSSA